VNVAALVERRAYLALLWKEICELRPLQRAALLLNLRDASGQDMLPLLTLVDVARLSEIAASLDMPVQEFAELWDRLPLDDATMAQRLGVTRQQVINLRKSARERLARRMAKCW
jgi:DNA-binding XRE family transcriptional regulator